MKLFHKNFTIILSAIFISLLTAGSPSYATDYFDVRSHAYDKSDENDIPKIDTSGKDHIQKFLDRPGDVSTSSKDAALRDFVKDNYQIIKDNAEETKDDLVTASGDIKTEEIGLSTLTIIIRRIIALTSDFIKAADDFVRANF